MDFERKRWRYLMAAMLLALCSGIGYAWSVFQKPLMENFDWTLKTISLTFTLQVMTSTIAPIFLSKFQKTIGVKNYLRIGMAVYITGLIATMFTNSISYLYLVYGIIVGIGIAMLYPALMAYATSMFPDKTGMASGLLACAYGSGAILWAPIATFFMEKHSVLSVYGLLAAIFAAVMLPTSFYIRNVPADFKPVIEKEKSAKNASPAAMDYTWKEMLKTATYYLLLIALTLGATAGLMIAGHASGMLQEILSYTPEQAAVLVGFFSVFNAFGRLIFGLFSDRFGRYNIMMVLFVIIGGSMILLSKSNGHVFIAALLAISSCYGGFTSMFSPVCADHFGMKNLAVNYAFLYVAYGLAGLIGPQLAARIRTASDGYDMAFLTVAGMSGVGLFIILLLKAKASSRKEN